MPDGDGHFYLQGSSAFWGVVQHSHSVLADSGNHGSVVFVTDVLYAHRVLLPAGGTIISIGLRDIASTGNAKVGLFHVTSQTNLTPAGLVFDAGIATNAASMIPVNQVVGAGLYYIGCIFDATGAGSLGAWRANTSFESFQDLGWDDNFVNGYVGWTATRTYAAGIPGTFPTATRVSAVPIMNVVLSAS